MSVDSSNGSNISSLFLLIVVRRDKAEIIISRWKILFWKMLKVIAAGYSHEEYQ